MRSSPPLPTPSVLSKAVLDFVFPSRLQLRNDLHLARKAWHMGMGLMIVGIYLSGVSHSVALITLGCFLGLDLLLETARLNIPSINARIVKSWGLIMRSCEVHRMSGIPFYISASLIAIAIFPKPIAALSIAFLAVGDPIASLFGILYGDKSIRFSNGKSLIGSLAGVTACALTAFVLLHVLGLASELSTYQFWIVTLAGGIAGGTAELLPLEVDDNFSIPVVSGFSLWLIFILLGI